MINLLRTLVLVQALCNLPYFIFELTDNSLI
ncbi:hypothetical protein [Enterococcus phage vB_Efm10_KEN22]